MFTQAPPSQSAGLIQLREYCGLAHDRQVIRVSWPGELAGSDFVRDVSTGVRYRIQRSLMDSEFAFLEVALQPFQQLNLAPAPVAGDFAATTEDLQETAGEGGCDVRVQHGPQSIVVSNGRLSLELRTGEGTPGYHEGFDAPGPVVRLRAESAGAADSEAAGLWRGASFFDCRAPMLHWRGELLETGPLRTVYRYSAEFAREGSYEVTITVDCGLPFAVFEEEFNTGSGDQLVWDFSGADLPSELLLLDSTAGYQTNPLFYYMDQRHTQMACWTQQSQHHGFSDGFALGFPASRPGGGRCVAGFVTLEGGTWRGGKLNQIEAWSRRWFPGDPGSRRDVTPEAKADAQPGPECIHARGNAVCEPHFNVEAWIGQGSRKWALVLCTPEEIRPAESSGETLGHFENHPDRERYRRQQSLLRKIHTQHGIMPLQNILEMDFDWPEEPQREAESAFSYPNEVLNRHFAAEQNPSAAARELTDYLGARVYGFWEGSGSAFTNPVVSRRVAPEMFRYEWLARQWAFTGEERRLVRAHFAFLMHLFASENYYSGEASMLPVDSPDSLDPTLGCMSNQNFYTDVINIFGTGAQVFRGHPRADYWRRLFIQRWHRQLQYHMYPQSGLWEESHTYYHHVLHTVLPAFLRRRADGIDDEFANPDFQKLAGAGIRQITPRDSFADSGRHLVIFGDHAVELKRYRYLLRVMAEAFAPHNHALSQNLAWAYQEMLGKRTVAAVAPRPPALRNEYVQGLGVMFRGIDEEGHESLMAFRSGSAWAHHHNDDGSLQFYAKGQTLLTDAGFGSASVGRRKFESSGHSRWCLCHHDAVNYLWRFNRGWIEHSGLEGPLPYATACSHIHMIRAGSEPGVLLRRPVLHRRSVVQLSATAYLVIDTADTDQEPVTAFHIPGEKHITLDGHGPALQASLLNHTRLTLHPLTPSAKPPHLSVDRPRNPQQSSFVTTAIEYPGTPQDTFSAFLISAGSDRTPMPSITVLSHGWKIAGHNFSASLKRGEDGSVVVSDGDAERRIIAP